MIELTVKHGMILMKRLDRAVFTVITRNSTLRTAYKFNTDTGCLEQEIKDPGYSVAKSYCQTESELIAVRKRELTEQFFHLNKGMITLRSMDRRAICFYWNSLRRTITEVII